MERKTLGGERLGAGKKMKVELKNYERSTHDLGYIWRSTMAVGTLVPFLVEVGLPGDTFDIDIDAVCKTHPTQGPLFASSKIQIDVFKCPVRLYNSWLHNNQLGIGMAMGNVKLPVITLTAESTHDNVIIKPKDLDNGQINPSCLLAYLGIRGVGAVKVAAQTRQFNAVSLLAYWDIYKNYYANKQETIGAVLHTVTAPMATITTIHAVTHGVPGTATLIAKAPATSTVELSEINVMIQMVYTGTLVDFSTVMINTVELGEVPLQDLMTGNGYVLVAGTWTGAYDWNKWGKTTVINWRDRTATDPLFNKPKVVTFPLANIDQMRSNILKAEGNVTFDVSAQDLNPYEWLTTSNTDGTVRNMMNSQEGLAIKTYQSDIFNNWLNTEWIDNSTTGISAVTKVSTTSGGFTIDALLIAKKVYDMLNQIAVSGGTYDDWLDAVYMEDRYTRASTPIYCGGLSKELVFQEVVSNAQSTGNPLGSLAGKGVMSEKHKGGKVRVKVDEPCYVIGLVSITPRIDYSQGNKWDTQLKDMDDFHKPGLDGIGFQDLIAEQMAWWSTYHVSGTNWQQKAVGKQPAWLNYMTNHNRTHGNFAKANNEMFMTQNRKYEAAIDANLNIAIKDLTTYIDPVKFNYIFAQTAGDAQNYWMQIAVDMIVRRKMSAKVMPNL